MNLLEQNDSDLTTWLRLGELEKVNLLAVHSDLPIEILVTAAKDSSLSVRMSLLSHLHSISPLNFNIVRILQMVETKDPEDIVRKSASHILKKVR